MKNLFVIVALFLMPLTATATNWERLGYVNTTTHNNVTAGAAARSSAKASSGSNSSTNVDYADMAPAVAAPGLVTSSSTDLCLGSVSGSVSGPGFGFSRGTTTVDKDCVQRRDIRLLHNLGHRDAALAMMCQDQEMGSALRSVGKCPPSQPQQPGPVFNFNDGGS